MEDIRDNGYLSMYQNGENQTGVKRSPAVEIYAQFIKQYGVIIRLLVDLLPKREQAAATDELLAYIKK